jgi:hypothetical protein
MRETSIEAYRAIMANGVMNRRAQQVYHVLFYHGPLTQTECWKYIQIESEQIPQHSISPRFAQMERRAVIRPVGKRPCGITGIKCLEWDVTANLPVDAADIKSDLEKWRELGIELVGESDPDRARSRLLRLLGRLL